MVRRVLKCGKPLASLSVQFVLRTPVNNDVSTDRVIDGSIPGQRHTDFQLGERPVQGIALHTSRVVLANVARGA